MRRSRAVAALLMAWGAAVGCGGGAQGANLHAISPETMPTRSTGNGRPPLAVVVRDGDVRGAVAVAVTTVGIAEDRGALAGVALAALVQDRLVARGIDVTATGGWNGWRMRAFVGSPSDAAAVVDAVRTALLAPVAPAEAGVLAAARRATALARRPLADPALMDAARCAGEAYGLGGDALPTAVELESWRSAAHVLGRVGIATAGEPLLADAAAQVLERAPVWPKGPPIIAPPWPRVDGRAVVYDASGELAPGTTRIVLVARTATPERAVAAAAALGDARGPLSSRLAALESPARVRSVVATAHVDGGCVAITVDLASRDLAAGAAAHIATATALARQELAVEITDAVAPADLGRTLAMRAADPRDAAERAAWWSLAGRQPDASEEAVRVSLAVGVAAARDASEPASAALADAIRSELDRATFAWHAPVVEARTRVERGQGEAWVLLASTCGTLPETENDAGLSAAVAAAAAAQATTDAGDARVEPFVAPDGIGLLVHGSARPGESPQAHARRLADLAARPFAAEPLDPDRMAQARTALLAHAANTDAHALVTMATAIAPGHSSWIEPAGTSFGLASASYEAIAMRAAATRAGPLRVAVVANVDAAQADAAVRAADRWVARRPGESRACPASPVLASPRAGTYGVDRPAGGPSEALIAAPLPPGDEGALTAAAWMAAALDGPDGLLAHALGGDRGDLPDVPLARSFGAALVGLPRAPALVVRLVASDASLDAAVAQVRGLLDHLRRGTLREEDRARAATSIARSRVAAALDPRERAIALWRGELPSPVPSLESLRSFAAAVLRDEQFVIVAARPQRAEPATRVLSGRPKPRE